MEFLAATKPKRAASNKADEKRKKTRLIGERILQQKIMCAELHAGQAKWESAALQDGDEDAAKAMGLEDARDGTYEPRRKRRRQSRSESEESESASESGSEGSSSSSSSLAASSSSSSSNLSEQSSVRCRGKGRGQARGQGGARGRASAQGRGRH